jgi:hypothetical protein
MQIKINLRLFVHFAALCRKKLFSRLMAALSNIYLQIVGCFNRALQI